MVTTGNPSAGGIFISYRREETGGIAGRLFDRLVERYGSHRVFMDVSRGVPGSYPEIAARALDRCDVMLAIVGPRWLDVRSPSGNRCLDEAGDSVRIELEVALGRKIRVIPVLIDGTRMPNNPELPGPIAPLAGRNAISLRHDTFREDVQRLVAVLDRIPTLARTTAHNPGGSSPRLRARRRGALIAVGCVVALALVSIGYVWVRSGNVTVAGQGYPSSGYQSTVSQTTEVSPSATGNGSIDQAQYDRVVAAAPKADDATITANSWAAAIRKRGKLNFGGTNAGRLFSYLNRKTGTLTGFDAGLAQMLAQYIIGAPKIALTLVAVDTRENLIQNGTVDTVFATYSITAARAKKVAFAGPYLISGDAIMVKKGNTTITKVQDLAGKIVATQSGSTAVAALKAKVPTAQIQPCVYDSRCIESVRVGLVDAYVIDQAILISSAVDNPGLKVVGEPFTIDPYGIGVSLSDPNAKKFVNAWLQKIYDDGSWAKLWKVTLGTVLDGEAPAPPIIGSIDGT